MFEPLDQHLGSERGGQSADAKYRVFELNDKGQPDFVSATVQNLFAVPEELVHE